MPADRTLPPERLAELRRQESLSQASASGYAAIRIDDFSHLLAIAERLPALLRACEAQYEVMMHCQECAQCSEGIEGCHEGEARMRWANQCLRAALEKERDG